MSFLCSGSSGGVRAVRAQEGLAQVEGLAGTSSSPGVQAADERTERSYESALLPFLDGIVRQLPLNDLLPHPSRDPSWRIRQFQLVRLTSAPLFRPAPSSLRRRSRPSPDLSERESRRALPLWLLLLAPPSPRLPPRATSRFHRLRRWITGAGGPRVL